MLENMLQTFINNLLMMKNLELMLLSLWVSFIAYGAWYFMSAKRYAPLTREEVRLLWKIHKHNDQCTCKKCTEIRRRDKIVGFECECGFKHLQKRPVT